MPRQKGTDRGDTLINDSQRVEAGEGMTDVDMKVRRFIKRDITKGRERNDAMDGDIATMAQWQKDVIRYDKM